MKEGTVFWNKGEHAQFGIELGYVEKSRDGVMLLVIQTDERFPKLDALGSGDHPCLVVEDSQGFPGELVFDFLGAEWAPWNASSEKHGYNVTLVKEETYEKQGC